ncbi:MAG: GlsB/YeaQ/YmgE family stress response rane protein [bacterium]|nr:GlsB/YeaQ/YmgE family stress response rane protein [bacterium]
MHILAMLIVGLIVGALAKLFMPGRDPGGILVTMMIGIAGSFVAGFIGRALGMYRDPASGPGIIASILGAMLLLLGYRVIVGRRNRSVL